MKTLFKTFSMILIALVLGIFSCSKDDGPPPTTAELLAHKWFLVKRQDLSTSPPTVFMADACGRKTSNNFLEDGTFIFEGFQYNANNTCVSEFGPILYTYSISPDEERIIVNVGMDTHTYNIDVLTETEFVYTWASTKYYFDR
ncbi:MAG: hypothetical protein R2783_01195 [Gelidibacter sp.]